MGTGLKQRGEFVSTGEMKESFLSGETIYQGKIIRVEKWRVLLPDGRQADREIVIHHGAAAVVPVDSRGRVTLVRQHRVAVGMHTWEIPAGKLDTPEEDPLCCAKRELEEETGLRAASWRLLIHTVTTPGFCTEKIALYLATGLTEHQAHADPDEFLHITTMPLEAAAELAAAGEFKDAKTCLGLLLAQRVYALDKHLPLVEGRVSQVKPSAYPLMRQADGQP